MEELKIIVDQLRAIVKSSYNIELHQNKTVKLVDKRNGDILIVMSKGYTTFLKPICLQRDVLTKIYELAYLTFPYSMTKRDKETETEELEQMRDEIGKELWIGMEGDRD